MTDDKGTNEVIDADVLRSLMLGRAYAWLERAQVLGDAEGVPTEVAIAGGEACAKLAAACTGLAAELRKIATAEKASQSRSKAEQEKSDPSQGANACSASEGFSEPVEAAITDLLLALDAYVGDDECEFFDLAPDEACDDRGCRRCNAVRAMNPQAQIVYPTENEIEGQP